jgi:hypothetical protein
MARTIENKIYILTPFSSRGQRDQFAFNFADQAVAK